MARNSAAGRVAGERACAAPRFRVKRSDPGGSRAAGGFTIYDSSQRPLIGIRGVAHVFSGLQTASRGRAIVQFSRMNERKVGGGPLSKKDEPPPSGPGRDLDSPEGLLLAAFGGPPQPLRTYVTTEADPRLQTHLRQATGLPTRRRDTSP